MTEVWRVTRDDHGEPDEVALIDEEVSFWTAYRFGPAEPRKREYPRDEITRDEALEIVNKWLNHTYAGEDHLLHMENALRLWRLHWSQGHREG